MASVELKSISGKGIKSLLLFQKPSLYTVISLTNVNQPSLKKNKKKTTVDRSNGQNPVWDQPIRIDIDISHNQDLILQFDLKADALLGDRVVGRAFVPVADLDLSGAVQHVSYQVKTPEGKANGAINFSYKADGPGAAVSPPIVPGPTLGMDYSPPAQTFYPAPSAPPVTAYPPQPDAASGYYPTVDPVLAYPPPGTAASGIYPPPDTTITYPPPQSSAGYYPKLEPGASYPPLPPHGGYPPQPEYCCREIPQSAPDVGGYYPPPAYPPQPECCCRELPQPAPAWYYPSAQHPAPGSYYPPPPHGGYPPPQPECCCREIPQSAPDVGGYYPPPAYPLQPASECCCRPIPQPPPAWYYPSAQQQAPAFYYPSPAPDAYGYQQHGWDGGLYGYN